MPVAPWQSGKSRASRPGKQIIKHLAKGYISRGSKTAEELEDLIEMHHIYKKLGGNGFCDALMEQVRTIPIAQAAPASASEKKSR